MGNRRGQTIHDANGHGRYTHAILPGPRMD
jgi:hypothetical protein